MLRVGCGRGGCDDLGLCAAADDQAAVGGGMDSGQVVRVGVLERYPSRPEPSLRTTNWSLGCMVEHDHAQLWPPLLQRGSEAEAVDVGQVEVEQCDAGLGRHPNHLGSRPDLTAAAAQEFGGPPPHGSLEAPGPGDGVADAALHRRDHRGP